MAITKLCQTFNRQYTEAITGTQTAVRNYYAFANATYDDLDDVITDAIIAGLPAFGDSYSTSAPSLVVTDYTPQEIEKELKFYSISVRYQSNQLFFASPTQRPWLIQYSSILEDYSPAKTLADTTPFTLFEAVGINEPILNTAGFDFDPTVTDVRALTTITLTKNFKNVSDFGDSTMTDIGELMPFVNSCNDSIIAIAGSIGGQYEFWMEDINVQNKENNGEEYFSITLRMRLDPAQHINLTLSAGWQDKNGKKILDDNKNDPVNPWPLDPNGDPIRGGVAARKAGATYLAFGLKQEKDWSRLDLPTSFG
jgi:hypothetical protein